MTIEDIRVQVRQFIRTSLGFDGELQDQDSLIQAGILDSIDLLDLVMFLQKTFVIRVADEDLKATNLDSVEAIAAYVVKRKAR